MRIQHEHPRSAHDDGVFDLVKCDICRPLLRTLLMELLAKAER